MATAWLDDRARASALGLRLGGHVIAAGCMLLFSIWALQFQFEQPPVPLIWFASVVALAATYRIGNAAAATVALAVLAIHLVRGAEPLGAALVALGVGAGGLAGAWLLRRGRFDPAFNRIRDIGLLLVVGGGVSAALSAFTGTLMVVGLDTGFAETFGLCWIADTMGVVLAGPLLLSARRPTSIDLESGGWLIGVPLIVYAIYAGGLPDMLALPASYGVFPLIMAVALRRSVPVVALLIAIIAAIAITCTAIGKGPFVQADMRPNMLALHAHLAMLALTGLLLAAIRSERQTAEARGREHLRILARVGRVNAMSTMAAGIAHEINQPICAVHSYAQAARRLAANGASADELDSVLERIVRGNEKVSTIVRRIRGFLRREAATRELLDLNHLVREAVELVRPECKRHRMRLHVDLSADRLPVSADPVEIEQVVVNLVQNAIEALDATPAESRWVRLSTRALSSRSLELTVTDGGPGLPDGDTGALFEPLAGAREGGSGLGLAIVRSIVEAHGGEIHAANAPRSETDAGAEFRIRLPLAKEPGSAEPGAEAVNE